MIASLSAKKAHSASHYLLICMLFLLSACSPLATPNQQAGQKTAATATPTTADPSMHSCPAELRGFVGCLTPYTLRAVYGVDKLIQRGYTGKGQTVIDIVSFGSPTLQQDMDAFDAQFHLPPVKLQVFSPLKEPISDPTDQRGSWVGETTLDVQIIHALAPDANIVVLTSPVAETQGTIGLPEFLQLEQYAIDHKLGNIVSQSWGASELTLEPNVDKAGPQQDVQWDSFFKKATTQQGMTYLSASGDNGATDYADLGQTRLAHVPTTSFPDDDPWVTAVGGTTVRHTGSGYSETAWNSDSGASGGGFSRFFNTPDYQQTLPASARSLLNGRRGVPDVAADADPGTGLAIDVGGNWTLAGGTSAAAPVWAAIMALANQAAGHPLGFINPTLYKLASAPRSYARDFHDITSGNNTNAQAGVKGYPAVAGWDPVTGLGTPIANQLVPDLIKAAS